MKNQWLKLVEYGDHPHPNGLQRVTKAAALEMQRKFHSLRARLARKFAGIPIYIGHPDDQHFAHLPGHGDKRSYAWVQDLEARDDGIWILPQWSEVGEKILKNAFFQFLSPRWEMKPQGNAFIPIRLLSVGLTNDPNIPGDPITPPISFFDQNATKISPQSLVDNIDATSDEIHDLMQDLKVTTKSAENKISKDISQNDEERTNLNQLSLHQINDLFMRLFSVNLNQPFNEIEKILTLFTKHAYAWRDENETLKKDHQKLVEDSERFCKIAYERELEINALKDQLNGEKHTSGEHFVNFAIHRGLILPNESSAWKEKYMADPYATTNELCQRTCSVNTTSKTENLRQNRIANAKDQILALVGQRMENCGESYTTAWNAVKKSYPALF
ncbi:MAG: phage protease [Puniceicoccales bacterium]|jgi:hypothetical protein|nr:phage protease [Puniceicoccales bacterium]